VLSNAVCLVLETMALQPDRTPRNAHTLPIRHATPRTYGTSTYLDKIVGEDLLRAWIVRHSLGCDGRVVMKKT
jgi:hypothetical protein